MAKNPACARFQAARQKPQIAANPFRAAKAPAFRLSTIPSASDEAHKVLEAYGARQQKTSYTGENSWEP